MRVVRAGPDDWDGSLRIDRPPAAPDQNRIRKCPSTDGGRAGRVAAALPPLVPDARRFGRVGEHDAGRRARSHRQSTGVETRQRPVAAGGLPVWLVDRGPERKLAASDAVGALAATTPGPTPDLPVAHVEAVMG